MWKSDYLNLDQVITFLVEKIEFDSQNGFSFCSVVSGNSFDEAFKHLGEPETYNTESPQQQTAQYNAFIDHPEHGKRDHHKLNLLLWAFNEEPISIIKLHFDYYSTGASAESFHHSINGFLNAVVEKLGPPEIKKLSRGKQELSYQIGRSKLRIWNNTEGVRVEIRSY